MALGIDLMADISLNNDMNRKIRFKIAISLFLMFCVISGFLFTTQASDVSDSMTADQHSSEMMDIMERKLETYRHEQLIAQIEKKESALTDFTTDGCSGGLSFAWDKFATQFPEFAIRHGKQPPWYECCVIHDKRYHAGSAGALSASDSFERRKKADLNLKICVVDTGIGRSKVLEDIYGLSETQVKGLYITISELMYRAVRIGGIPCTEHPWRWGYGWPLCDSETLPN